MPEKADVTKPATLPAGRQRVDVIQARLGHAETKSGLNVGMSNEDALIKRLLGEAEEAVVRLDWATVHARCDAVLALEPGHERAIRLGAAAARALGSTNRDQPPRPSRHSAVNKGRRATGDGQSGDVESLLSRAETAADAGDWPTVKDLAQQALAIETDNMSAYLLVAEAELEQGDFEDAARSLDAIIDLAPADASLMTDALLMAAEVAWERSDWKGARSYARSVLDLDPDNEEAQDFLDDMLVAKGNSRDLPAGDLNQEIHYLTEQGWQVTSQTPQTASLVLRRKGTNGCLIVMLLLLGILPGILYIMWPRKDQMIFLELLPDNTVRRSGKGSAARARKPNWKLGIAVSVAFFIIVIAAKQAGSDSTPTQNTVTPDTPRVASTQRPRSEVVSRLDFGDRWPLTVAAGELRCVDAAGPGLGAVTFKAGEATYALNGAAMSRAKDRGWRDIQEIWLANPSVQGAKINIGPLLERGLSLCY